MVLTNMENSVSDVQKKDMTGKDGMVLDLDSSGPLFRYRGSDCCFNSCSAISDHYHCQVCGTSTLEVSQALAHLRASPSCRKDHPVHYPACSVAMATDAANSLYNAIYSGFTTQNTFPPAGLSGYNQIDSFQWHPSMPDCNSQLSPCCSSNGGSYIPVETQLCSPISDLYSKVTPPMRDLVSLPAKSAGSTLDSQAWFTAYTPQQIQKTNYKYSDQNSSPQINFLMLDTDQKHVDVNSSSIGDSSLNLPSTIGRKTDQSGKDIMKDSYCAYTSQMIPGVLSDEALFALQLPDEALKQADLHSVHQQSSLPPIMLSDVSVPGKSSSQLDISATSSRADSHFTQEHFGQYMSSCSAYPPTLEEENQACGSKDISNQPSSAASDSDESDIIVEDTGDELEAQMTESEIFIEDIKCSLLQGVVGENDTPSRRGLESYDSKVVVNTEQTNKNSKQANSVLELQSGTPLKNCVSSYHTILKCVMCEKRVSDEIPGSVFVQISNQMPLTTISQTPISTKLNEVIASELADFLDVNGKFICHDCFSLVDTFDSLESKLESLKRNITTMVKTGSKQLAVRVNPCAKLMVDLIEQNQSAMLTTPSQKISSVSSSSVCVQEMQGLFETSLESGPSIVRTVGSQEHRNHHKMVKDSEHKEYLLLSNRGLSIGDSMGKGKLSLDHETTESMNEGHCGRFDLEKVSLISTETQQSPELQPMSEEAQFFTCGHEELPNDVSLGMCTSATRESSGRSKEGNIDEHCSERRNERGKQDKGCEEMMQVNPCHAILPSKMDVHQPDEEQSHSSDCTSRNCHEQLILERQSQGSLREESYNQQQLKFACNLCPEIFSSREYLDDHLILYSKKDPALCELCGKLYHDQTHLNNHFFYVHFIYLKLCEFCNRKFAHPCMYKSHMKIHQEVKESSSTIFSSFPLSSNTTEQENLKKDSSPFTCRKCDQSFSLQCQLEQHTKERHEQKKKALLKCDKCERTFIKPSDIQAHQRSHSNEKNFECKICGRCYKSLGNLNHHAKSHASEKPYTCEVCSQGFIRKEFFETHLNSHKGEKPFKCEKCGKGFWSKSYLQVHLKWHMDKTKKVTCPICKKSFSQRLNVHMRSHTGERPHSCQQCSRKFITGSALRKHMKQVHKQLMSEKEEYLHLNAESDRDEPDSISVTVSDKN